MTCYDDEVLADTPLLYWPLPDSDSPFVADESGNSRDGAFGTQSLASNNIFQNSTTAGPASLAAAVLNGSGVLAINITTPSPLLTGDLRYVAIAIIGGTSVDLPSGATALDERDVNGVFCGLYEESVTASTTATYTCHGPAGAQANWRAWRFFAAGGHSARLARANYTTSTTELAVTDHDVPSRTVLDRWDVLVNVVLGRVYDPQLTDPLVLPPVGMTNRSPAFTGDGIPVVGLAHQGVYYDGATSGATGVRTWTLTDQNAADIPANPPASMDVYGVAILLQPTPVPGPELNDLLVTGCDSPCADIEVPFFARQAVLAGEYVDAQDPSPIDGLETWSIELWFWADESMVSIGRLWAISGMDLRVDPTIEAGRLRVTLQTPAGTAVADTMPKVGCWNHAVIVSSAADDETRLYLRGGEVADGTFPLGSASTAAGTGVRIGLAAGGSSSFRGDLGHFALYDVALDPARIAAHFAYGCAVCREGPFPLRLRQRRDNLNSPRLPRFSDSRQRSARVGGDTYY